MALPSLSAPEFITAVPSTGEEIKYRPFLVKEEKTLLILQESEDKKDIVNGLKHFIKTYEFINKEELNPEPTRKQKRND